MLIHQHLLQALTGILALSKDYWLYPCVLRSIFPTLILSVEILSGQHIPRPHGVDEGEVIDPYVEVW